MATSPDGERLVSLTFQAREDMLPHAVRLVEAIARQAGLPEAESAQVARAAEEACRNAVQHAFDPGEQGEIELSALRRPGQLVLAVRDQGIPFEERQLEEGHRGAYVMHAALDEVRVRNLGRDGMRVDLVKNLPSPARPEPPAHGEAEPLPEDLPVEIRLLGPEDTLRLERCVYHTYGYSYATDEVYDPERMAGLMRSGLQISAGAVTPDGEVVGHVSLALEAPDAPVVEIGQAAVNPRMRGRHILERLEDFLLQEAASRGALGVVGEAVTLHPYTQKACRKRGGVETGMIPGWVPTATEYRGIRGGELSERLAVILYYFRTADEPPRDLFAPPEHREMLQAICDALRLRRQFQDPGARPGGAARIDSHVRPGWGIGTLRVERWGDDAADQIRRIRDGLCRGGLDVILCDLPLQDPATPWGCQEVEALGFSFGGMVPELHHGDVLRLIYLSGGPVDGDRIVADSELGQRLKSYVLERLRTG